jgi:hypothetical protein
MKDAPPKVKSGTLRQTLYSRDRKRRLLVVERNDGRFHMLEEWLSSDNGVSCWSHPMHPLRGVYDSAERAAAEAATWPAYRESESHR